MIILKLEKTEIGILITYKNSTRTKKKEVIKDSDIGWKWAESDNYCLNDCLLDKFNKSEKLIYTLNGV